MSAAPARYYTELRRSKNIPLMEVDEDAVAIAHHRANHADSFCMNPDAENCIWVNDVDREYAADMAEILTYLPDWPSR